MFVRCRLTCIVGILQLTKKQIGNILSYMLGFVFRSHENQPVIPQTQL